MQPLDSNGPTPIEGTENASYPFWSTDSRSLGFFSRGKLKRIDISGGPPQLLCEIGVSFGGTWSSGGVILFPPHYGALSHVPASGGTPNPVISLDPSRGEFSQQFPQFLPDGRHFLYFVPGRRPGESSIRAWIQRIQSCC